MESNSVIIIGGAGHVGLPLGIAFANAEIKTCLYDRNLMALNVLWSTKKMPFIEYGADELLPKLLESGMLNVTSWMDKIREYEFVIVCVGTPVDEYMNPKVNDIIDLLRKMSEFLTPQHTVIIRSTVYPKTMEMIHKRLHPEYQIAYCPERITQGYAIKELNVLPQIIASENEDTVEKCALLFKTAFPKIDCIAIPYLEAELLKLFTNAHRYIQFAIANEFYRVCETEGANYNIIRQAMTHKYPRIKELPAAGFAAGPCLLKDTMQLVSFNPQFSLGIAAEIANENLPDFLVNKLVQKHQDIHGFFVGLLGMAFKANIDDTRDSLSFKLKKLLEFHGAVVMCHDPYSVNKQAAQEIVNMSDIVFVCIPHKEYDKLTFPSGIEVINTWA